MVGVRWVAVFHCNQKCDQTLLVQLQSPDEALLPDEVQRQGRQRAPLGDLPSMVTSSVPNSHNLLAHTTATRQHMPG